MENINEKRWINPGRQFFAPVILVAALTTFSASLLAQTVNYTFTAGPTTTFTNGDALSGTMAVDFTGMSILSANLLVSGVTNASFDQTHVINFGQFTNVVCGTSKSFYEASFTNAGHILFLDFEQGNTTTPIPGTTGVHTSFTPSGGINVKLSSTCAVYNNPAPNNTVLSAVRNTGNKPAEGAAEVIDNHSALSSLFSGTDQQISEAVSQTLPLLTGGSQVAVSAALSGINRVIQARIESNRGLSSGDTFFGDRKLWMKPFGSWADQNDRGGVSGFDASIWGLALGADGTLDDKTRLGVAFAYANGNVESNSTVAPQSADVSVYQLIGYGSRSLDASTELNFQIDVGQNKNKGRRTIAFASTVASADYDSWTAHAGVGVGRTFMLKERTNFTPSVRADYTWFKDESYSETGAGLLNLNVNSRSSEELILSVDGKLTHEVNPRTTVTANVGVGYDVINDRVSIISAFAGAPSARFTTNGLDPSPWLTRAGLGVVYQVNDRIQITARYDAEYREDFLNQTASAKARWAF